jgi:hypothetical protein
MDLSPKIMLDIIVCLLVFEIVGLFLLYKLYDVDISLMWPAICGSMVLMLLGIATASWLVAAEHVVAFVPS